MWFMVVSQGPGIWCVVVFFLWASGTGSCQKIMGVGLCTYDATATEAVETMTTQAVFDEGLSCTKQRVSVGSFTWLHHDRFMFFPDRYAHSSLFVVFSEWRQRFIPHVIGWMRNHSFIFAFVHSMHKNVHRSFYDVAGGCCNQPYPLRQPKHWLRVGWAGSESAGTVRWLLQSQVRQHWQLPKWRAEGWHRHSWVCTPHHYRWQVLRSDLPVWFRLW